MEEKSQSCSDLRDRSGEVEGNALAGVLYELMRDGLVSPGVLEKIVARDEKGCVNGQVWFTNGWLGLYAKDLATRIEKMSASYPEGWATVRGAES